MAPILSVPPLSNLGLDSGLLLTLGARGGQTLDRPHAWLPVHLYALASKELVDLLQGQVAGLGVEEVDQGQEAKVEDAKADVGAPLDVGDADGGDFDDEEGKYPYKKRVVLSALAS